MESCADRDPSEEVAVASSTDWFGRVRYTDCIRVRNEVLKDVQSSEEGLSLTIVNLFHKLERL